MTNEAITEPPSMKYLKLLIDKAWKKKNKIIKVYKNISSRPIHYLSIVALKSLYLLHYYIFLGPSETICQSTFNLEEFLSYLESLWQGRFVKESYDREDLLKNSEISKFIVSYSEFLRAKINYHKKYYFIGNNFSIDLIKKNTNFDYNALLDKKFINDTMTLYSLINQRFICAPYNSSQAVLTMDLIAQALNEEIISMFNFIFFLLNAYKHHYSKGKDEKVLKLFDSTVFEITNKSKANMEKLKKLRAEYKVNNNFVEFPQSYVEYLKSLDNHLMFFPVLDFNPKTFFLNTRELSGIRINRSLEEVVMNNKLVDPSFYESEIKSDKKLSSPKDGVILLRSLEKPSITKDDNVRVLRKDPTITNLASKGFNFSEDKFQNMSNNFNFEVKKHASKRSATPNVRKSPTSNKDLSDLSIVKGTTIHNLESQYKGSVINTNVSIDDIMDSMNKQARGNTVNVKPSDRVMKRPEGYPPVDTRHSRAVNSSDMNQSINNNSVRISPISNVSPITNNSGIKVHTPSNISKNENPIRLTKMSVPDIEYTPSKLPETPKNSSPLINNYESNVMSVLNEIFDSNKPVYNQVRVMDVKPSTPSHANEAYYNDIMAKMDNAYNQKNYNPNYNMNNSPTEWYQSLDGVSNNAYLQTNYRNNNNPLNTNNMNYNPGYVPNQPYNNNYTDKKDNRSPEYHKREDEFNMENLNSQFKSDYSNVNFYSIQNNITNYNMDKTNLEKAASEFLQNSKLFNPNQFILSSKEVKLEKQIGFGGTSEVYKGTYRGTDVAVKKLRLLDITDEALKEYKREVASLIICRHPNLVLFMGAIAEPDNICIVTEYCAGGTLFSILHQRRDLIITWELRLRILIEIATGMNFLHTNNPPIIHRDLKSLNLLLTEKIERPTDYTKIKISDFGLSKLLKHFDSERQPKMTGQLGTCHWMAPEVIENKNYTIKADLYSFGIIIWEICTRKTPYSDMTQQQISYYVTVKKGRPDKSLIPPNTPPQLIKLMERCWDHEPNNRPSFLEIIDYLKSIKI